MKRLLGSINEGRYANGELIGYVAIDLESKKAEPLSIDQTKQLAKAGQLVNAKLVNGELEGTESSIKRLNQFNRYLVAANDSKYTVLQIMTVKDEPVKVVLTDPYGAPKVVDYEEALQRISDKGAVNAKIVNRDNKKIISAILGELPRKEISPEVSKDKDTSKKQLVRTRYINNGQASARTLLSYSNSRNGTGCTTRIGDRIVINYSKILGIKSYTYNSMRRLAHRIYNNEAYKKTRAHYPNTFNEIAKSSIDTRNLYSIYDLAQATTNQYGFTRALEVMDPLVIATLKDYVIYSLATRLPLVKDKEIKSIIKEILASLSVTTDKDEIIFACNVSDSINNVGVDGKEFIDTAYIIAYGTNGSKLPNVYKKYNDYLVASVKGWKKYTLGSKKVEQYEKLLTSKLITSVELNGAVLSVSERGALEYSKGNNTIELDRPVSFGVESTEIIGLYKESENVYKVVRANTSTGAVDASYNRYVSVRGDKIIYGVREILNSEMYKDYLFSFIPTRFGLTVIKSYDGTLYSRYIPNQKIYDRDYIVAENIGTAVRDIGKLINESNYTKFQEVLNKIVSKK